MDLHRGDLLHEHPCPSCWHVLANPKRCQLHRPAVLPVFLKNEGFYAFYMFAAINILLAAFVWFFVPETKKVSLEEMDAIFGGQNHVVEGAAIEEKDPAAPQRCR